MEMIAHYVEKGDDRSCSKRRSLLEKETNADVKKGDVRSS